PMRRAGSPVHVSPSPRIANETPASFNSVATARVVFFAPSSHAPPHPPQNRYSKLAASPTRGTGKSSPLVQSARVFGGAPHGLPLFSRLRSITPASDGKLDSISTWYRRMSTMWSTCSMSTGHCSTQAPQVVHDQSTSGSITPPEAASPTRGRSYCSLFEP